MIRGVGEKKVPFFLQHFVLFNIKPVKLFFFSGRGADWFDKFLSVEYEGYRENSKVNGRDTFGNKTTS